MIYGIVGCEEAKFTPVTQAAARRLICAYLLSASGVTSGECHLGGIDIWAKEEALAAGVPYRGFPPKSLSWEHYKRRNIQIAESCDHCICITLREYPATYFKTRYGECYHCGTSDHVKSGGCWTVKYAQSIGKTGEIIVI